MSDATGCVCNPELFPFKCERHGCRKGPRWFDLCKNNPEAFAQYESGKGPGQATLPEAPAPSPQPPEPTLADLPCEHRGNSIRNAGCDQCGPDKGSDFPVYACGKFGECTLRKVHSKIRGCLACEDRTASATQVTVKPVPSHQFLRDSKGDRAMGWFNLYRGGSAFLICGGPSLDQTPLHLLKNPGLLTAAVNNAAVLHRPNLWFCVDVPGFFSEAILRDNGIAKFMMWKHNSARLTRWNDATKTHEQIETRARDLPNTWFFEHDRGFDPNQFLIQPKPTWGWGGAPGEKKALACDVMLPSLRILHWMGIRTLYLVGCDFKMDTERPYAFDEQSSKGRVNWNNSKYKVLNGMFREMAGHFSDYGLKVFNCTPGGNLTAFPRMSLDVAVETALNQAEFPREIQTRGMYQEG